MDLITQLKRDEGEVLHVYLDSRGIRTAGVGHNLESHGIDLSLGAPITQGMSDIWLEQDTARAKLFLSMNLPWTKRLDDARLGALQNMSFQLGTKLIAFHRSLTLIQDHYFKQASIEMLASAWAREVPERASRLAEQVRTGVWV